MESGARRARVLGIAGGSASGKSCLVDELRRRLGPELAVLHHDWYYLDLSHLPMAERERCDFDDPSMLETSLLVEQLDRLRAGQAVDAPTYRFEDHCRDARTQRVEPRPWIVVEGLHVLAEPALRERQDLRIFLDAPDELRLQRRIQRDVCERGRTRESVIEQWRRSVDRAFVQHVSKSRQHAHRILDGSRPMAELGRELELQLRAIERS